MTGPADLRIAGRIGLFIADACTEGENRVYAEGRWRTRLAAGERWTERRTYSWRTAEVIEIRWKPEPTRAQEAAT